MGVPTSMSSSRRPVRQGIGPVLAFGLGLVILLAGIGWLGVDRLLIGQGNLTLPNALAGLPLSDQIAGRTALVEIKQLHGQGFPLVDGAVTRYGQGTATIWVSSTWAPFLAGRQVQAMTERIAEGRSPFVPTSRREVEGTTVYALTGMGQVHYYFRLDRRVVWLAISPSIAEQGLEELLRALQ
jgi:hypothetical protein